MQAQLRNWLIQSGFPEEIDLTSLRGGLGSTSLWTFSPSPNAAQMVVRTFPEGSDTVAEREYLAMRAAARHGVPVPTVIMKGEVDARPVLVTTFATGIAVTQQLARRPSRGPCHRPRDGRRDGTIARGDCARGAGAVGRGVDRLCWSRSR